MKELTVFTLVCSSCEGEDVGFNELETDEPSPSEDIDDEKPPRDPRELEPLHALDMDE
jgi:hypothetical protein